MKISRLLAFILISISLGCANPFKNFLKKEDKIAQTQQKIQVNKDNQNDLSSVYVYGISYVLSKDNNKNEYSTIAKDFADKSLLVTGNPPAKDALQMKKIVDGLVSTNKDDIALATKLLEEKDKQILKLEKKQSELEDRLGKQNEDLIKTAEQNAKDAQLMVTLRRWFRISIFSILGLIGFRLACVFVPQLMPIGLILDNLLGGLFKITTKALPKAADAAGLIAKETHELSEKTLQHLVEGIEEFKAKHPDIKDSLKLILKDITDKDTTRVKILDVKKDLGYI